MVSTSIKNRLFMVTNVTFFLVSILKFHVLFVSTIRNIGRSIVYNNESKVCCDLRSFIP